MTLTDFLLARIAEDERHARKLAEADRRPVLSLAITVNHPQRLLAECEAKRRIVAAFEDERVRRDIYNKGYDDGLLTTDDDLRSRLASNAHCRGLEIAMRAHASTYADHPDYDQSWRP